MKFRLAAAAACLALPVIAQAQPVTGPYVSLGGGTSIESPTNFAYPYVKIRNPDANNTYGRIFWKPDYAVAASAGYGFGDGIRIEIEGDYIRNTAHKVDATQYVTNNTGQFALHGGEEKYGPMVNVLYDFSIGLPVFPYIGAGAGYQWVKYNHDLTDNFGDIVGSGTKGSFAYQIIAGLAYPLPWVPGLSLTAEDHFMELVSTRKYSGYLSSCHCHLGVNSGEEFSNTILGGLRYQIFNPPPPALQPAPMPVAAPAPAPAKTYLVFFDWDKSSLTPRATTIIAQAAADSKTTQVTTIQVSGYTDTSGTPTYNMGLSERRAQSVAAQLVADGVPASEIETHSYGETHLLVQTGPGVREPQNRRVEIVFD